MWDLSGPGFEPVSPALAGGFLTTEPPGKYLFESIDKVFPQKTDGSISQSCKHQKKNEAVSDHKTKLEALFVKFWACFIKRRLRKHLHFLIH